MSLASLGRRNARTVAFSIVTLAASAFPVQVGLGAFGFDLSVSSPQVTSRNGIQA